MIAAETFLWQARTTVKRDAVKAKAHKVLEVVVLVSRLALKAEVDPAQTISIGDIQQMKRIGGIKIIGETSWQSELQTELHCRA